MKTKQSIRRLTVTALGTALVCVCTRAIQIPIPLGYAHLGDFAILLFAVYFGPWVGALAAGAGSALADLLSYPEWTLATFVIKCLMGWAVATLAQKQGRTASLRSFRVFLAALAGMVIMVLGYFLAGSVMYGSAAAGAAQIPGLSVKGLVTTVLFYVVSAALEAAGLRRWLEGFVVHTFS